MLSYHQEPLIDLVA